MRISDWSSYVCSSDLGFDRSMPVNGRNLTNAGPFRKYIELYTHNHPGINKNLTFIVRQLSPGDNGLPLELYKFTSDIRWVPYEGTMRSEEPRVGKELVRTIRSRRWTYD